MSYLLLPSMPESKMASMEPQGTQLQCKLLKDEKQDGHHKSHKSSIRSLFQNTLVFWTGLLTPA